MGTEGCAFPCPTGEGEQQAVVSPVPGVEGNRGLYFPLSHDWRGIEGRGLPCPRSGGEQRAVLSPLPGVEWYRGLWFSLSQG